MSSFRTAGSMLAALVLVVSGGVEAQEASVPTHANIVYAAVDGRDLALDLYLPRDVSGAPLLVWIHGGAWQRGSKELINTTNLVDRGFAIASVDFRNSVVAPFPAQIHDIRAAIRFLREKAGDYGYDASRIGIHGRSSGGHLTALVSVTNGHPRLEGEVAIAALLARFPSLVLAGEVERARRARFRVILHAPMSAG